MTSKSQRGYPPNFFDTNEMIHKVAGVWFPGRDLNMAIRILYMFYVFLFYSTGIFFMICEILIFKETLTEISKLVSHIGMLFTHIVGILKFSTLVFRRKTIRRIMDTLQDSDYFYEDCAGFHPGQFFAKEKRISAFFSILVFVLYSFVGISAHISSLITINKENRGIMFEKNNTCNEYIQYYFRNPFPAVTKRDCEWYAFMFMDIGLGLFAWLIACHDGVFVALLNCLKSHLLILGDVFKNIRPRVLRNLNLPENYILLHDENDPMIESELYRQLTHCTDHLRILLKTRDDIEDIFTFITLSQALASLLIFASCLYVASTVSMSSPEFFAQVEYFLCVLVQLSLICYFGNEITSASQAISTSMYDCDWFGSSVRFKKSMLITMSRMQRPVYLSIGKFTPLTLATLVAVCRGSFSYFALFKSIQ